MENLDGEMELPPGSVGLFPHYIIAGGKMREIAKYSGKFAIYE
jgi:hypothetical protein